MGCWRQSHEKNGLQVALYGKRFSIQTIKGQRETPHLARHLGATMCVYLVPPWRSDQKHLHLVTSECRQCDEGYFLGDAIMSPYVSGLCLALETRDCPSVVLYDPTARLVSLVHAGRNQLMGLTRHSILTTTLSAMVMSGARPSHTRAYIMGSIGAPHFAHEQCPEKVRPFRELGDDVIEDPVRHTLSLPKVIRYILRHHGVPDAGIVHDGLCTYCTPWLGSKRATDAGVVGKAQKNITLAVMR